MEKARLKKLLLSATLILSAGIAYCIFVKTTGKAIPCVIFETTGFYCDGCGLTRMFTALLSLDFIAAAQSNIFAFVLLVPSLIFAVKKGREYVKTGKFKLTKTEKIIILLLIVLAVGFMVLRNLPYFSFLAPN